MVRDVGDRLCWWQLQDVEDRFEMLVTDFYEKVTNKTVLLPTSFKLSPSQSHQLNIVTDIAVAQPSMCTHDFETVIWLFQEKLFEIKAWFIDFRVISLKHTSGEVLELSWGQKHSKAKSVSSENIQFLVFWYQL